MGDLVGGQPEPARAGRSAFGGPVRERHRHVRVRDDDQRRDDARAADLDEPHADVGALGAGLFHRQRQDLGHELDHGVRARALAGKQKNNRVHGGGGGAGGGGGGRGGGGGGRGGGGRAGGGAGGRGGRRPGAGAGRRRAGAPRGRDGEGRGV